MRGFAGPPPMSTSPSTPESLRATSLDKKHIRVLLLEGIHASAQDALRRAGYTNIVSLAQALQEDDLIEHLQGVHMLCLLYTSPSPRDH